MNRLQHIMNAFDLVVKCRTVSIVKVHLSKPRAEVWFNLNSAVAQVKKNPTTSQVECTGTLIV